MSKTYNSTNKHCLNRTQYKPLQEVCEIANSKRKTLEPGLMASGDTPYYGPKGIKGHVKGHTHNGNYILIARVGSPNLEDYSVQYTEGKIWANENIHVIRAKNELNNKFLFHFLKGFKFSPLLTSTAYPMLTQAKLAEIPIPLPQPEVQNEIVRKLDQFTKLNKELGLELKKELEDRKRQFTYSLNTLFSFDSVRKNCNEKKNIVNWQSLGELGEFVQGTGLKENVFSNTGIGCVFNNQIYESTLPFIDHPIAFTTEANTSNQNRAQKGDLLITTAGPNRSNICKAIAWLGDEGVIVGEDAQIFKHSLNPKYIAYFFKTTLFQKQMQPLIAGTMKRYISNKNLSILKIPVFPTSEQERIVNFLDNLLELVYDNSTGLPAEISLRRKQFEQYRNQLLTIHEVK